MGAVTARKTEVSVAKSPNQPDADRLEAGSADIDTEANDATETGIGTETDDDASASESVRAGSADRSLWQDVRIDPVEIALPSGVGYTLRAYRSVGALTPTDISGREEDDPFAARRRIAEGEDDDETVVILDEEFAAALDEEDAAEQARPGRDDRAKDNDEVVADADQDDDAAGEDDDEAGEDDDEAGEDDDEAGEEVPVFLSHRGSVLLFKNPEALVSFIRSSAPHDLAQLDTWSELVDRVQPADIDALAEDTYELDLVVENLRGGHDVWDARLLIQSGEIARDLAYALRMPSVLDMLSAGSSLDDLDEALRSTVDGGIGGFMARRRLKKIGAQTASLGWRTIIGKISAAADWRD
ncbi:DNA primase [Solwaraspora sp. WMMB335]|uniref:DNA primase n=1 Tax=Solwaraspora sp. WMMB335 TaxID=3404118 RepID=UPI003B92A73D